MGFWECISAVGNELERKEKIVRFFDSSELPDIMFNFIWLLEQSKNCETDLQKKHLKVDLEECIRKIKENCKINNICIDEFITLKVKS